jgi:signal transduction histidine kinase
MNGPPSVDVPEHETLHQLRSQFRAEQYASWIAALGVLILALAYSEPWGIALALGVGFMATVRLPSFRALDRHDVIGAMWWEAAGTWGVALVVAGVIPDALPIMVLNLIGPLITGAMYLAVAQMRRLIFVGVAVAVALGALGFRSEGTGIEDAVPEWTFQVIMIVYLAAHVILMSTSVSGANRVRLATLTEIAEANRALVRTDAELRTSRRRVIAAGDEERIRVERNIHDGAQQRLVALAVQLQLASQLARQGTPPTAEQLEQLQQESRDAIDELRVLARGIYPSILTERGLPDALRSVAERSPNPVTVEFDPAVELSHGDSAAVYFICLEALQNVAKHAAGAATRVTVRAEYGRVIVEVSDDGPGFDVSSDGSSRGLLNMADRAGALGGDLVIDSTLGAGTQVTVVLAEQAPANVVR